MKRIIHQLQDHLVATISLSVFVSLALTGTSSWNVWRTYQNLQSTITKQVKVQDLSGKVVHFDEVLTMSAKMAASTGDLKWENRYKQYEPELDQAIKGLLQEIPETEQLDPAKTDAANQKLIALEGKAFDLVRKQQAPRALAILDGSEYEFQKMIYASGTQGTIRNVKKQLAGDLKTGQQNLILSMTLAAASLFVLTLTWSVVLLAVRNYIQDRQQAQHQLMASQANLEQLNQQLAQEVEQRSQQEQAVRENNGQLEADIAELLDVVMALEEGDLTTQAAVNERATGLVGDTLNRLIESLNQVISVVVSTAQSVTQNANQLEQVAVSTADQIQQQTQSVQRVKSLMDNVAELTHQSVSQSTATAIAVQLAKTAVVSGQQEMTGMVNGIATLQQSADQMVKRSQTLDEFVALAAQFSKDQKRVATLTRVLALNASTLSSRALQEEDPAQFVNIANEFDAIARQVNDLATQTTQSLGLLQQRTDQIQTVTTGLSQDMGRINHLVQDFTQGAQQAQQAFENLQNATEQVEQAGHSVKTSSQTIAKAVEDTKNSTQAISNITEETLVKAMATRQQAEALDDLAQTLLELVNFFRIKVDEDSRASSKSSLVEVL
jgi:twitching motility protein PilJ